MSELVCSVDFPEEIARNEKSCLNYNPDVEKETGGSRHRGFYSTTYGIGYRHPEYPFRKNMSHIEKVLKDRFETYKMKADSEDHAKEIKFIPPPPPTKEESRGGNCGPAEEEWWVGESDNCVKNMVKKYMWTTTYREMNKDGAALPMSVFPPYEENSLTKLQFERPIPRKNGKNSDLDKTEESDQWKLYFPEAWDPPQTRIMASKCDTIYENPHLERCPYFQDQNLNRFKFAKPAQVFESPTLENLQISKENKFRMPFDIMVPGYSGYKSREAPQINKLKQEFNIYDPRSSEDTIFSMHQASFVRHPEDVYLNPVKSVKKEIDVLLDKYGIPASTSPINSLAQMPLVEVKRLTCA